MISAWSKLAVNKLLSLAGVRLVRIAGFEQPDPAALEEAIVQRNAAIAEKAAVLRYLDEARAERDEALVENLRLQWRGEQNVHGHMMMGAPNDAGLSVAAIARAAPGPEALYFKQVIKSGQTVLDVGANIGLFTLQFAQQVGPAGRVYAFEPGPLSFGLLQANVALNHYRNVVTEHAAVTSFSGETELLVCRTGESDNRIAGYADRGVDREAMPVKCFALDDYFDRGRRIDLIKLDIQGAEMAALSGMQRIVTENPDVILSLEFVMQGASPVEDLFGYAERFGFHVLQLLDDGSVARRSPDWLKSNVEYANLVLQRPAG